MIENELKRMFPGIQFHHVDDRKSVEIKHSIRKDDEELTDESSNRSAEEARELEGANRVEKRAWKGVMVTDRALPNKLRGRHTR